MCNNMTNQQEKEIMEVIDKIKIQGIKAGAKGILGAVLKMCNEGKTVSDIKGFCEKSLKGNLK